MERALKKSQIEIRRYGDRLEVNLPTVEAKDEAIKGLERADPAAQAKDLESAAREHP